MKIKLIMTIPVSEAKGYKVGSIHETIECPVKYKKKYDPKLKKGVRWTGVWIIGTDGKTPVRALPEEYIEIQ